MTSVSLSCGHENQPSIFIRDKSHCSSIISTRPAQCNETPSDSANGGKLTSFSDQEASPHRVHSSSPLAPNMKMRRRGSRMRICDCLFAIFALGILVSLLQTIVTLTTNSVSSRQITTDVPAFEPATSVQHRQQMSSVVGTRPEKDIPVFYNLYVNNASDADGIKLVSDIIQEQFSFLKAHHKPVFVNSIGKEFPIPNTTLLKHYEEASEVVTLRSLWQFCLTHNDTNVVYLHSKGSFHPSPQNDHFRRLITLGALSDQCATLPSTCNVCSSRFSPFPHPHAPGNAWLARCSYVQQLIDPANFEEEMALVKRTSVGSNGGIHDSSFGTGRFAAEHWIHSHPSSRPCDLYTNQNFQWGYENLVAASVATILNDFELEFGPRYDRRHWRIKGKHTNLNHRLNEYKLLYDIIPEDDWWGWSFWLREV